MSRIVDLPDNEHKKRLAWRPIALSIIAASVLTTTGVGVFATLSASVDNITPQAVNSGTLELSLGNNGVGFSQSIDDIAPGDVVNRFITLTNSGTLEGKDLKFETASTGTAALITNGVAPITTKALVVSVSRCSVAWTPGTGVCGGTTTSLLPPTTLSSAASAQTLLSGSIPASQNIYLRISVELPDQDETTVNGVPPAHTVQGGSVDVTYTFIESQRTAVTANS